jgi:hypothetical protein
LTNEASVRRQQREEYRSAMPGQVGDVFADLWQDVVMLQATWEIFTDLFASEESTVQLLNEISPFFFRIIQELLLHELHMSLSRMTDPPVSGRGGTQRNVSLPRLLYEIEAADPAFTSAVRDQVDRIVAACAPLRAIRNKVIGHNDFDVALEFSPSLPGLTKAEFEQVIGDIIQLMNTVEEHYRNSLTHYKRGVAMTAVYRLVKVLQAGSKALATEHQ